ncbi:phenylalanyl-tRNA synthetase beta subunit [Luteibacter sp. UNCMF331Sha3.1]|uniref:phenylalanine--tRNA ligase subunit beta n=1 Tax=Luteibacter sp. UNCMF331Sha3.1 TaxID=1502760 RepID=UPI0008BB39F1|nr:phenylalanine--tRNA ligase subunit beta [Luteibacter sp. UNCMF331Sha3.1]SEM94573.1 phenylalanyl-tRNA synthetase beta subunit [Luteibacter sp. UNCMF331Sha3.1]
MKFSENWLRELVTIDADRPALVHALTMSGLEVEEVTPLGAGLDGVVVAQIVEATKHPEADRLQVCKVDTGQGEPLQIVCGAPNARVGIRVPLATVGATLPGGIAIKAAKLRGVESFGMLCSAKELGIDADASGLLELPSDAPVGESLATYLGLPDATIELKVTPNRPDVLGLYGLAHDVAALFGSHVKPIGGGDAPVTSTATRAVKLEAGADAPRYLGRVVEGVDATARSPLWLAEKLRRAGIRPISAIVDITQYVMLELGHPLHAFDNDRLSGAVIARHAREGETLTLLDGSEAKLDPSFVVIADEANALAVAGVMGGQASRVTDETRNVFLEAAHFTPAAIMGRARKLGLHTDASHRFERGVDPALPKRAIERATELLLRIAGGKAGPITLAELPEYLRDHAPVVLRHARLRRVLGIEVAASEVTRIFTALGMGVVEIADGWRITPPSSRFDIEREEDLIEEVARIHGYERIPTHIPAGEIALRAEPEARLDEMALRDQLAARGYFEAVTLSFVSADLLKTWSLDHAWVPLANPLSADLAVMRTSLLPGLIEALRHNRARQQDRVRLFEVARSFHATGGAPDEVGRVALVASGSARAEQWGEASRAVDFFDVKGDLDALIAHTGEPARWRVDANDLPSWLHPGRGARVLRDGLPAGFLGALHPALAKALDLGPDVHVMELALEPILARRLPSAGKVPRFPAVRRDIAVELPEEVSWASVEATVREALGDVLVGVRLFDRYAGKGIDEGRKSLAMGLILQDASRTLTDDDADARVADAVGALEKTCKARLRG